jgi:L-lactate permease
MNILFITYVIFGGWNNINENFPLFLCHGVINICIYVRSCKSVADFQPSIVESIYGFNLNHFHFRKLSDKHMSFRKPHHSPFMVTKQENYYESQGIARA